MNLYGYNYLNYFKNNLSVEPLLSKNAYLCSAVPNGICDILRKRISQFLTV